MTDTNELRALLADGRARIAVLEHAIMFTVDATRAYLPPDGISAKDCLSMIIGATDNPEINPIIADIEAPLSSPPQAGEE